MRQESDGERSAEEYMPLADLVQADDECGPLDLISTCGFKDMQPICIGGADGGRCFRGVCVCTSAEGCRRPMCAPPVFGESCPEDSPPCADGKSCISARGSGWSCWHPCNWDHSVADYGLDQSRIVSVIRTSGRCTGVTDTSSDPDFGSGLRASAPGLWGTIMQLLGGGDGEDAHEGHEGHAEHEGHAGHGRPAGHADSGGQPVLEGEAGKVDEYAVGGFSDYEAPMGEHAHHR